MQSKSHPGITGKARDSLARILEHVLQEEGFLLATMREYRGQVTGPNLYSLRRLFDEQRSQLNFWLDRIVERTKSIGLRKRAVATKANQSSAALGVTASLPAHSMIGNLLGEHERIAQHLRHDIERLPDPAMADLLQRLVEFHETTAWMLRVVHTGRESDPSLV